jgi:prepilin-type N-terminal cleavage/methylation domain-containing protein
MSRRRTRSRGFTLPEVLAAAAILALSVAAIAQAVAVGQAATYAALREVRVQALAEALFEEVLALPYDDPDGASALGPEADESTRDDFDNADDFDGFAEAAGAIRDAQGQAYPSAFQSFSRSVSMQAVSESVPGFSQTIDGLSVTVTVTNELGATWAFTRFVPRMVEAQ